jgi:cell division septal protein FtsQ
MAARKRRRRRTFRLAFPLSLRLGGGRASASSERKRASKKQVSGRRVSWSRVLAAMQLLVCAGLLVWFFVDLRFYIFEARVEGPALVDDKILYQASNLNGYSVFYIDRAEVADCIRAQVPGIEQVYVECRLPSDLSIRVEQGDVRFTWHAAGAAYLVDGDGLVLQTGDGAHGALVSIHDLDERPLQPGERVTMQALTTVERLHSLLPEIRAFEYSQEKGVSLYDARGWRIFFGDDRALAEKVASMRALLQKIASRGETVKLIDLRFVGSPYYE